MARERTKSPSGSTHSHDRKRHRSDRSRSPSRRTSSTKYDDRSSRSHRDSRDIEREDYDRERRHRYRDDDRDRERSSRRHDSDRRRSRSPTRRRDGDEERRHRHRDYSPTDSPRRRDRDERPRSRERTRDRSHREQAADTSRSSHQQDSAPTNGAAAAMVDPAQPEEPTTQPDLPTPEPVLTETPEEQKLRIKQERLAAWKASRERAAAAEAAKAAGSAPSPSAKPTPISSSAKGKAPAPRSQVSARLGLPTKAAAKSNGRASATSMMMDDDEEGDDAKKAMFRPEVGETQMAVDSTHLAADDGEESEDDELARDDTTGVVQSRESEEAMAEDAKPERTVSAPVPEPMPVDEDEEVDELDAYMNSISNEVKKVNAADRARGVYAPRINSKLGLDDEVEPEEVEKPKVPNEEEELEAVSLRADDMIALATKKLKKKDLTAPDHSKIDYEPFRLNFYSEPPEIKAMTPEQAADLRLQLDGIKIRGTNCPKPVTKWSHCGLPGVVLDVIKDLGYEAPTPIQTQAIPAIMSGRDVIGVAKTGSGKTIAFLLPLFRQIKDQRPLSAHEGPIAMIMTPTRELAVQIHRECKPFLKALNLRAAAAYGGSPLKDNIGEMKRGAEIVVCTPGRMIELLTTNSGKIINLRRVTYLVLDEADRMFDMGFEPQVMKIIGQIRPDRQTVLFSATFPKQMEGLARKVLRKGALELTVGGRSKVAAEIEQVVEVRTEETKFLRLLELLGEFCNADPDARALIFVDRQEAADKLFQDLTIKGYLCQSLHGGKEQVDRDEVLIKFKSGEIPVVIATSVAARGLDVKQLKLVVNYDCPNHMEDYVHRAGRTGRAGNKGTCVTFVTPEQDRYAVDLVRALKASEASVPPELEAMHDAYLAKLKASGKHYGHGGFGGKGLDRFDQDREQTERTQRKAFGEPVEEEKSIFDEDVEVKPEVSAQIEQLDVEIKRGPAPDGRRPVQHRGTIAMERAALVAANLSASLRSQTPTSGGLAMDAEARRLADPGATDFHAVIPINDYPQKARWRVTNKETMSQMVEVTGASVTLKGIYYEKGKEVPDGAQPKLQLLIESNDEAKVKTAINAIKRLLLEATAAALEAEARNPSQPTGRYSI